jgi:hypothetical protein
VIFLLIYPLSFPPEASTEDPDHTPAVSEPDGEDSLSYVPETKEAVFLVTMRQVLGDNPPRIGKCVLREIERHAVASLILPVLLGIPFE